jgi:hypothetical protein
MKRGIHIQSGPDGSTYCGAVVPYGQTLSRHGWWPREETICQDCLALAKAEPRHLPYAKYEGLGEPDAEERARRRSKWSALVAGH